MRGCGRRRRPARPAALVAQGSATIFRSIVLLQTPNPDFSHAEWNCRQPVGGETCDGVELCERFVLGGSSNRESFSPSAFQLEEKVPKADEGAFHACVIR